MTRAERSTASAIALWLLVPGCWLSRASENAEDGGAPVRDAAIDAGALEDLAPPCVISAPTCSVSVRSVRELEPGGAVPGRDVLLRGLTVRPDAVDILVQVENPGSGAVTLTDHSFARVPLERARELTVDAMDQPQYGADVAWDGASIRYGWFAFMRAPGANALQLRTRTLRASGELDGVRVLATLPVDRGSETFVGPALVMLGDSALALTAAPSELVLTHLESGEQTTFSVGGAPWDSVVARAIDRERFAVLWHDLDAGGFARAWVAVADDETLTVGPVLALQGLSNRASLAVIGDAVWVAGFERDATLERSRLRLARLSVSDLARTEPDRWFSGWGGLHPAGFQVVAHRGAPWLVWLTDDSRFGGDAVVYVEPVPTLACGRLVRSPALVSSAPFDWTRRYAPGQLSTSADEAALYVAHTIGSAGLFDLHAIQVTCRD
jgi:hypothetical protein